MAERMRHWEDVLIGDDPPPDGLVRLTVKMERSDGQSVTSVTIIPGRPDVLDIWWKQKGHLGMQGDLTGLMDQPWDGDGPPELRKGK